MRGVNLVRCVMFTVGVLLALAACQRNDRSGISTDKSEKNREAKSELPPYFRDVTAQCGIDFTYRNGEEAGHYAILESLGGGVALIDYDGDGLLDVFIVGGGYFDGPDKKTIKGRPNRLYKNLGGWKFRDVTAEVGLDATPFYGHGAAVADYDCDGWPDLLVTGYGGVRLYHNEIDGKGGRRFVDVTKAAGLAGEHIWATSAAWGDLDGDGFPDLYVCQYVDWSFATHIKCLGYTTNVERDVCPPKQFEARPHLLFHNDRQGHFKNVAKVAGLRCERSDKDYGKGLGVIMVDVNGDGKPDIYVANDTTDNLLYINKSKPGELRFEEVGLELGVARDHGGISNGSMGVDAGDYDGGGRPSLWVTNYENELHGLYRNVLIEKRISFIHSTQIAGIAAIGQAYVGFGTGFLDVDHDGWEDLVITNGHVIRHPYRGNLQQIPILLRNRQGRFEDATSRGGAYFTAKHRGRGLALGDLDNDGKTDLVFCHVNEPATVLQNVADSGHHWLGVALATKDKRDVVGATVRLTAGGRKLTRFAKGGGSYLSANDPRLIFGLEKAAKIDELTVMWPAGAPRLERWRGLAVDRYHRLEQGSGEAVAAESQPARN
jgi:enediyne biosynthesis protein E4